MAQDAAKGFVKRPLSIDVWCELTDELVAFRTELDATDASDVKRRSLLLHELGRLQVAVGNEAEAARNFLEAYRLRPQFRPTLRLARALYRQRADFALAAKLYGAEARATRDPAARAALLRRQAHVLWARVGDLGEAIASAQKAAQVAGDDLATLGLQEILYLAAGDLESRIRVLERKAGLLTDPSLQAAILVELGRVLARTDLAAAQAKLAQAHVADPQNPTIICELEQVLESDRRFRQLAELLVAGGEEQHGSEKRRARHLARAARIYRSQLHDQKQAAKLLERSLALAETFPVAADLFELRQQLGDRKGAIEVGERLYATAEAESMRPALASQLGDLLLAQSKNTNALEAAAVWYERALAQCPTYLPALEGLGRALQRPDQVDRLHRAHLADLNAIVASPLGRSMRYFRIAALFEEHGRDDEAIEAYRQALEARPTHHPSRTALERIYLRLERWQDLLALYEGELRTEPDPERAQHVLESMTVIYTYQLKNTDLAIEAHDRLLELLPGHLPSIRAKARLAHLERNWPDLINLNEQELAAVTDPRRRTELLQRTGEVWENELLNLDRAIACYKRALEINPRFLLALRSLGRLYRQKARWSDLLQMHRAEIAATDDAAQVVSLLYDVAEIYEEQLLDEQQAAQTYSEILVHQPEAQLPALDALSRILKRRGDHKALADLIASTLDGIPETETRALQLFQLGALRDEHLGDQNGAIKAYLRAYRLAPKSPAVRAALERLLEQRQEFHQLADLYGSAFEQAESKNERAALCHRLAELWDRELSNPRKGALLFERAAELYPSTWSLTSLARVYEQIDLPRELTSVLEQLLDLTKDPAEQLRLHARIGLVKDQSGIADPVHHFNHLISGSSSSSYSRRAIERHLRNTQRLSELAAVLVERIEQISDPMELASTWSELGQVHLERSDPRAAERAFREALIHSPSHLTALFGLGQLLEQQNRWQERAELAEAQANAMEAPQGIASTLLLAANLYEKQLGDVARAVSIYQRVHRVDPGNEQAYQRLNAICRKTEDYAGLASLIRTRISANAKADVAVSTELLSELATIYLDRLDQPRKGEACLRRVLELTPDNVPALRRIAELYYDAGNWKLALTSYQRLDRLLHDPPQNARIQRRLGDIHLKLNDPRAAALAYARGMTGEAQVDAPMLRKIAEAASLSGDAAAQVKALEQLASITVDPGERVQVRKEVAQIAEAVLDDDDLAVQALEEALVLNPLDIDAIERLAAVYGRSSNRSAAKEHLQAAVAHHRAALPRDPFDAKIYHQLARVFQWQREFDRLYCCYAAIEFLGHVDEVQSRFLSNHGARCAAYGSGGMPREEALQFLAPDVLRSPLRAVMMTAGTALQRRASVVPASAGVTRTNKLKPSHPVRQVCDRLVALIGGAVDFDVYVSTSQGDMISAEVLGAPALLVGSELVNREFGPGEHLRLAKAIFLIAEHALVLRDRSVREIGWLFSAMAQIAIPPVSLPLPIKQPDKIDAETKHLARLLPRKERKLLSPALEQAAAHVSTAALAEFARGLGFASMRFGLLAAGSPRAGLREATLVAGGGHSGPEVSDLLQFTVSDEYFELRRRLGIAPNAPQPASPGAT